jgi:hypothetical protein
MISFPSPCRRRSCSRTKTNPTSHTYTCEHAATTTACENGDTKADILKWKSAAVRFYTFLSFIIEVSGAEQEQEERIMNGRSFCYACDAALFNIHTRIHCQFSIIACTNPADARLCQKNPRVDIEWTAHKCTTHTHYTNRRESFLWIWPSIVENAA